MTPNVINNQYSDLFFKRRKYIFLLIIFFILIVVLAIINPFLIFSNYLYATLPIILFFSAFITSMLFLYTKNFSDLTIVNLNSTNWLLKFFILFLQLGALVGFAYWITATFQSKTFADIKNNTYGDRVSIGFNFAILLVTFLLSVSNLFFTSKFSTTILGALFLLFLSLTIIFQLTNSNATKYIKSSILCFYCAIGLGFIFLFSGANDFKVSTKNEQVINDYFLRSIMFLFGFGVSALFIYWIVVSIGTLNSKSNIVSFILNALIVITILGLAYKALNLGKIFKSFPIVSLFINILLYIPCVLVNIMELIATPFGGVGALSVFPSFSLKQEYQNTTKGSIYMLIFAILLFCIYFSVSYFKNKSVLQGGNQLLNEPVYLNIEKTLGTYAQLNGSNNFNYQYALSFWFYIDSSAPSYNASYTKYTSILTYGNKPSIKYNAYENTLIIVEDETGGSPSKYSDLKNNTDSFDENGMRIIYKKEDILLQKWNNLILNYTGGTLDVFYNGTLVKSSAEVIPYMTLDTLVIGDNNGLNGGICNVIYFNTPLNARQIYHIYNSVKNKTPPTLYNSNFNVMKNDFALAGEGDEIIKSKINSETNMQNFNLQNSSSSSVNSSQTMFSMPNLSIPSLSSRPNLSIPSPSSIPTSSSTNNEQYKIPSQYQSQIPSEYQSQIPSQYK
jgi:hypothetical protein